MTALHAGALTSAAQLREQTSRADNALRMAEQHAEKGVLGIARDFSERSLASESLYQTRWIRQRHEKTSLSHGWPG